MQRVSRAIGAIRAILSMLCLVFGGVSVIMLVLVSVVDVTTRTFGAPILGAQELSKALLLCTVSAALPISVLGGRALIIEGLVDQFPKRVKSFTIWLGYLVTVVIVGFLAFKLITAADDARAFEESSPLLQIPFYPLYLCLSVGMFLTALAFILVALGARSKAVEK